MKSKDVLQKIWPRDVWSFQEHIMRDVYRKLWQLHSLKIGLSLYMCVRWWVLSQANCISLRGCDWLKTNALGDIIPKCRNLSRIDVSHCKNVTKVEQGAEGGSTWILLFQISIEFCSISPCNYSSNLIKASILKLRVVKMVQVWACPLTQVFFFRFLPFFTYEPHIDYLSEG